mmetsp:Transcript_5978/g.18853  ORF Transcript_5978/g.18853 Transcript_5978/m.18853 type:complete len:407 (+) Transcript_5978:51-1271(+)
MPALPALALFSVATPVMRPTPPLRPCTVVVAGANGRVGSMVCRQLLRTQEKVTVRALVRSADRVEDYARLSYEVGAEDARYALRPAWALAPEEDGGGFSFETQSQFDETVQSGYGLDRLELVPCELRHEPDLRAALRGAVALVWCASEFEPLTRRRLPGRLADAASSIGRFGADLFELRLPGFGRGQSGRGEGGRDEEEEARVARASSVSAFEGAIDDDGVALAAATVADEIGRRARIAALTGGGAGGPAAGEGTPTPFVLASGSAALGYDVAGDELQENEFGFRKRRGEASARAALRRAGVAFSVVRSAAIDASAPGMLLGEGLPLCWAAADVAEEDGELAEEGAAGRRQEELRGSLIAPRDLAAALVEALAGGAPEEGAETREVWTQTGKERAAAKERALSGSA